MSIHEHLSYADKLLADGSIKDKRLKALCKAIIEVRAANAALSRYTVRFSLSCPGEKLIIRELQKAQHQLDARAARLTALLKLIQAGKIIITEENISDQIWQEYYSAIAADPDDDDRALLYGEEKTLEDIYG